MTKFNIEEIKEFIKAQSDESKIYLGCDSEVFKKNGKWFANYYIVVVVHYDGCKGCKVFGHKTTEDNYGQNTKSPNLRLMNEVYKVAGLYLELAEAIADREVEVHLDINPDIKFASSAVIQQAVGYIKGTCNVVPMVKPNAFAASYAADRLLRTGSK